MAQRKTRLSIRLDLPDGQRFGPGKSALLGAIAAHGSIAAAARALNMSYPRASRLVDEMNRMFKTPLVETFQGGARRGGAVLTPMGNDVATLYTAIVAAQTAASARELAAVSRLMKAN
jgi:molybdate transport system regulatory protein